MYVMTNCIQNYSWGSKRIISEILGRSIPSQKEEAELWMGAHPLAPSQIIKEKSFLSLDKWIQENPRDVLGENAFQRFKSLPFLFKLMAVEKPLSIQAHPCQSYAKIGFLRENMVGIPFSAPNRNYKDDNHKPEMLYALNDFWLLKGFRPISDTIKILDTLPFCEFHKMGNTLRQNPTEKGLKKFFFELVTLPASKQRGIVEELVVLLGREFLKKTLFQWIVFLNKAYPEDIGSLFPILLNLRKLRKGESIYIQPGELHSYLQGVGLELMANSDNVLRGGLTPKHIDREELYKILDFKEGKIKLVKPQMLSLQEKKYKTEASEFELSEIHLEKDQTYFSQERRNVEILFCYHGKAEIVDIASSQKIFTRKGTSIVIPASVAQYSLKGEATLYKATVPILCDKNFKTKEESKR